MSAPARWRSTSTTVFAGCGAGLLALGASAVLWLATRPGELGWPTTTTSAHLPLWSVLRLGCMLVSVGALLAVGRASDRAWRVAVLGAGAVLVAAAVGEVVGALHTAGVVADPTRALGDVDAIERRMFRLASMAACAVPLLALLAAWEHQTFAAAGAPPRPWRLAELVLRLEPWLFAVGACTLAALLAAAAFVHREIAWALPIGSDTALAGCAAAAVRARRRRDKRALFGWLLVVASMSAGLLMGTFAFGGPLPAPSAIGPYHSETRTMLRDLHVAMIAAGLAIIATNLVVPQGPRRGRP